MKKIFGVSCIVLSLSLYFFYSDSQKLEKFSSIKLKKNIQSNTEVNQLSSVVDSKLESPVKGTTQSNQARTKNLLNAYRKCSQNPKNLSLNSMNDLRDVYVTAKSSEVTKYKQYDVISANGKKQLIDLTTQYNEFGQGITELQILNIDENGYPEETKVDKKLRVNPSQSQVKELLKSYTIVNTELAKGYELNNNSVDLVERNGKVIELTVISGSKTLSCVDSSCNCYI